MTSNCDEKAEFCFSLTISEAKTNECCSPPSAGKFTFASFQVIPWSPSSFHKRLVMPLVSLKINYIIMMITIGHSQFHISVYSLRHQLQHANFGPVHEEPERKAKVCACVQRWAFQRWHIPNGIAIRTRQQKVT